MAHMTRLDIRKRLSRLLGGVYTGTATAGSTSTVVDTTNRIEGNNELIGWYIYIDRDAGGNHAAPEGEERYISDFDQSSSTITVTPSFTAAVSSGDTYTVMPYRKRVLDDAIEDALLAAYPRWYRMVRQEFSYSGTGVYELPVECEKLLSVSVEDEDKRYCTPLRYWEVRRHAGAPVLYLGKYVDAGDSLELVYIARPKFVASDGSNVVTPADTDVLNIWYNNSGTVISSETAFVDYLCYVAAIAIWTWKMGSGSQEDTRDALNKVQLFRELARKVEIEHRMPPPAETWRGRPWAGRDTTFGD